MKKRHLFLCLLLCLPLVLSACQKDTSTGVTAEPTPAKSDDIIDIAIVGDSITHDGRYLRDIEIYYLSRYPETPTRWHNCGLGGEMAKRYFSILETDLYPLEPDKVIIMFGMNDLNNGLYGKNPDRNTKSKESAITSYQKGMRALVEDIKAHGIDDITLFVPSPFDNVLESGANSPYYNDALAAQKDFLTELATEFGCTVVDMNTPLVEYNLQYRALKAEEAGEPVDVSVIGTDRVHPGPLGTWLMAYTYFDQMNLREELSDVTIDAATKKVTAISGASIPKISTNKNGYLTFTYSPWRLPIYPCEGYDAADTLVPLTERYNNEKLTITNLADGEYQLLAKGTTDMGTYTAEQLAAGVNLFEAKLNPNRLQAVNLYRVAESKRTNTDTLRKIRTLQLYIALLDLDINDPAQLSEGIEHFRKSGDDYSKGLVTLYESISVESIQSLINDFQTQMLTLNQPVSYEIVVKKVG